MEEVTDHPIDRAIRSKLIEEKGSSWDKTGKIYPSSFGVATPGGGCLRAAWEQYRGAESKRPTIGMMLLFTAGDRLHDWLQGFIAEHLDDEWEVTGIERKVEYLGLRGRLDLEITHRETGERQVWDIKTKRGNAFQYLNEPKLGDVLQCRFYIAARNADSGGILYVDREGQNGWKMFEVTRDDDQVERCVSYLRTTMESEDPPPPMGYTVSRTENKGPDSVYLKWPWQMEYCNLETCPCAAETGPRPPKGIVCKLKEVDETTFEVEPYKNVKDEWVQRAVAALRVAYPDQTFIEPGA